MTKTRGFSLMTVGLVLATSALQGDDLSRYRDFQLGANLSSVSALTGVAASQAKTVHQRPAVIQELEWRLPYLVRSSSTPKDDPVRLILFSFYDDQLFKMVVEYAPDRTAGMTDADMIEAISTAYGSPSKPAAKKTNAFASRAEEESGTPVARWGGADYSAVLHRSSYAAGFRLIVSSPSLEAAARTASARAIQLDEREAPQREIERRKKEEENTRVSQEKSRTANKAMFRP